MKDEEERNKLYELEKKIVEQGEELYYSIVRKGDDEFLKYIISRRIHAFRNGLYPTTKKIILRPISDNWLKFLNDTKITNKDYKEIFNEYKDNDKAFLYLDPPYMDSYNAGYNSFQGATHDKDLKIIDNTQMYVDLLDILENGKCKVLFSINDCAITRFLYKSFIKETYNHMYATTHLNILNLNDKKTKKHTEVLIISNFE